MSEAPIDTKKLELLAVSHDPIFEKLVDSISIVKDFIESNGLIVYGGSAIDYALRLKGDSIYHDDALKVPDLDFYSPQSVPHAYELADVLFDAGYEKARAICAQHLETMRVDIGDNHFVADISYRPPSIFAILPTLTYERIKIIHPDFQRIDIHSSLSFPFDNPPREVFFARWVKDLERFNKLAQHYPITADGDPPVLKTYTAKGIAGNIMTNWVMYSLLFERYVGIMESAGRPIARSVVRAKFAATASEITFSSPDGALDIVHNDIQKRARELELSDVEYREAYVNLIPRTARGTVKGQKVTIYSTHNRLISINSHDVGGLKIRLTNIQFVLKQFLSSYFIMKDKPEAKIFLHGYISLITMIQDVANVVGSAIPDDTQSLFFPSVNVYGSDNIDLAREVGLNALMAELGEAQKIRVPVNYYPGRSRMANRPRPYFDAESLSIFHMDGRALAII